jgi:hypothetical protein
LVKSEYNTEQLTVIRHFVEGDLYIPEDSLRFFYYPETFNPYAEPPDTTKHWIPTVWFDGVEEVTDTPFFFDFDDAVDSTRTLYREKIEARRALDAPLTIGLAVDFSAKGDSGAVQIEVIAVDTIAFQGLTLRLAVIESGVSSGMMTKDQALRDYLPDVAGIPLTIAQGDTFTHQQPFVIQAGWQADDCRLVAFVQDDTTREVLQAVQAPVITPAPAAVSDLIVTLSGDDLLLDWTPVNQDTQGHPLTVDHYLVYRDTLAFRDPGAGPFQTAADTFLVDDTGAVGDLDRHYFYWVTAVSGTKESADSPGGGEFDRQLVSGK